VIVKNKNGNTLLDVAKFKRKTNMVECLLALGVSGGVIETK
jgi:hypothetical protein